MKQMEHVRSVNVWWFRQFEPTRHIDRDVVWEQMGTGVYELTRCIHM
jgi:hypothetical protein